MKRFHVNLAVRDLDASIRFYSTLFGQEPSVAKPDYAKWMLDDPRINFSLTLSQGAAGVNHIGLQADTMPELGEIQDRLRSAGATTFEQPEAECCYAASSKTWVSDPDDVAWETFVTHEDLPYFGSDTRSGDNPKPENTDRCCG